MEETDVVRGHVIHYCADYHDAVDFGAVLPIRTGNPRALEAS